LSGHSSRQGFGAAFDQSALFIVLRRISDVLLTLDHLLLAGVVTLEITA